MGDAIFLTIRYKKLLNEILPASFTKPVRYNHCFNRIILDWLFQDVWYHHLNSSKTAISQLNQIQLQKMVERMEQWLQYPDLLFEDNQKSITWRKSKSALKKSNTRFLKLQVVYWQAVFHSSKTYFSFMLLLSP